MLYEFRKVAIDPAYVMIQAEIEQAGSIKNPLSEYVCSKLATIIATICEPLEHGGVVESEIFNGNCKLRLSISREDTQYGYNLIEISKLVDDHLASTFKVVRFFYEGSVCVWGTSSESIFKLEGEHVTVDFKRYQHLCEQFCNFLVNLSQSLKLRFKEVEVEDESENQLVLDSCDAASSCEMHEHAIKTSEDAIKLAFEKLFNDIKQGNLDEALQQTEYLQKNMAHFHILHDENPLFHL